MAAALSFGWMLLASVPVSATSVREASVAEMIDESAVIFEGIVIDVRARKISRGTIVTDVVFEVTDVIKGRVPQKRLKLEFLGGEVAGEAMDIPAMDYPKPGERGIYFAEAIDRAMIHPLYGWDQGRFLVSADDLGEERVTTADNRRVINVDRGESQNALPAREEIRLSSGAAKGVSAKRAAAAGEGLTAAQFKRRIRDLMGGAQ